MGHLAADWHKILEAEGRSGACLLLLEAERRNHSVGRTDDKPQPTTNKPNQLGIEQISRTAPSVRHPGSVKWTSQSIDNNQTHGLITNEIDQDNSSMSLQPLHMITLKFTTTKSQQAQQTDKNELCWNQLMSVHSLMLAKVSPMNMKIHDMTSRHTNCFHMLLIGSADLRSSES